MNKRKFDELDEKARLQVWHNLLTAAKIDISSEVKNKLSKFSINGRQIKNAIRIAQCLANNSKVPISYNHFEKAIKMM